MLLLLVGIPLFLLKRRFDRFRRHQVLLIHGVDADADVFSHELNAQCMGKSTSAKSRGALERIKPSYLPCEAFRATVAPF